MERKIHQLSLVSPYAAILLAVEGKEGKKEIYKRKPLLYHDLHAFFEM